MLGFHLDIWDFLTFGVMVALIAAFLTNINHVGRLECPHECLHPWHDRQKS